MSELVQRLRDGLVEYEKRWSGDTHYDLGGSCDYDATDELMDRAADRIEALEAENARMREALSDMLSTSTHCGDPIPLVDEEFAHKDSIFSGNLRAAIRARAALEGGG